MSRVIFLSSRPLGRCENITAVYNAYNGEKVYDRMYDRTSDILRDPNAEYDLVITDELVKESKAPVIMIYHGATLGKTYLMQRKENQQSEVLKRCAAVTTYAVTSSESGIDLTALQCGISPEKVLPLGMPRMDAYFGKKKGDGNTVLSKYKCAYLYAPTYRTLQDNDIPEIDLGRIDTLLTDNEVFAIKPHMVINNFKLGEYKHIIEIPATDPSTPYLIDCDVLVTDYSSILMDGHVLGKPVVLYEKDAESYLKNPGMTLPYPDGYASRHARSAEELVRLLKHADKPQKKDEDCRILTCGACDGHSTERVIQLMNNILEGKR